MADVLSLPPVRNSTNNPGLYRDSGAETQNETVTWNERCERHRTVVHVDFESKDLQLLRYKARELEAERFVLYKQSTRTEINIGLENYSIAVRVLVQKRMVRYYFYCPVCGTKVLGSLFPKVHGSENYGQTLWKTIEEAVQNDVTVRALDHGYLCHGIGTRRG